MRAGGRRHRHGRHAGQRLQPVRQPVDQLERTLHGRDRLQRMQIADAGQPRHLLVDPGIVLHGARAQRIDAHVDGVVLLAEPRVVLHHLRLRKARQADLAGAAQSVQAVLDLRWLRQVDAAAAGLTHLEDQRLLDLQRAIAGESGGRRGIGGDATAATLRTVERLDHHSTSFRPAISGAMPASVAVSVAASSRRLSTEGSSGISRDTGTPARMRRRPAPRPPAPRAWAGAR